MSGDKKENQRKPRRWPSVSGTPEERASKGLERLEDISRLISEWVWEADAEGRLVFVSERMTQVLGYIPQEIYGKSFDQLGFFCNSFGEKTAPDLTKPFRELTFRIAHKDGHEIMILLNGMPFYDRKTWEIEGYCGTAEDITEHLKGLRDLRRLTNALDKTGDGIILFDDEDRFVYANQKYREIYPTEIPDLVPGKTFRDIVKKYAYDGIVKSAVGREEEWIDERVQRHQSLADSYEEKTHSGRWVRINEFRTDEGGIFGVRTDITDLKESQLEAEDASRAKSEFLSSMSHELRTPLNAILGFGQLLKFNPKETLSEAQSASIDHILAGGDHLLRLINDVLDLAKVESGKVELETEHVSASGIFQECAGLVQGLAADKQVDIVGREGPDVGVVADYGRLRQVVLNLMSNAVKYNKRGGSVSFGCEDLGDNRVCLSVTDTGNGISQEQLDRLFTPFDRLGMENSGIEGTGIGLTISKQLVEAMGGEVKCKSTVGSGTTFSVYLPGEGEKRPDEGASHDAESEELPQVCGKILYIEDNSANMEMMRQVVRLIDGLTMLEAGIGQRGIMVAQEEIPDLIILDINLPDMTGIEALQQLRDIPETMHIPAIALSAAATESDIRAGLDAGFQYYLTKPINVIEVTNTIKGLISSSN